MDCEPQKDLSGTQPVPGSQVSHQALCLTEVCKYLSLTISIVSLLFRKHPFKDRKEILKCDGTRMSRVYRVFRVWPIFIAYAHRFVKVS